MMKKNRTIKFLSLLIGFLFSLLFSALVFHPQPVSYSWISTIFSVLVYGYTWITLIVVLVIKFSKDKSCFRCFLRNNKWMMGLGLICLISIFVSWKVRFINDLFFLLNMFLATLLWLSIYFRLKIMIGE